ncbi:MAG TPA: HPF/RaiA family ribosome-associated protein [Terriglobales bacterium]|nr:HPF/RaiA family ribosome-associated protein [Terriglobales bacterium]
MVLVKIQINSDSSVSVDEELSRSVKAEVGNGLSRFEQRITRVEVHLSDVNGPKFGTRDLRCLIEARPANHEPVTASNQAATLDEAVRGATGQLHRLLETLFGRMEDKT